MPDDSFACSAVSRLDLNAAPRVDERLWAGSAARVSPEDVPGAKTDTPVPQGRFEALARSAIYTFGRVVLFAAQADPS